MSLPDIACRYVLREWCLLDITIRRGSWILFLGRNRSWVVGIIAAHQVSLTSHGGTSAVSVDTHLAIFDFRRAADID